MPKTSSAYDVVEQIKQSDQQLKQVNLSSVASNELDYLTESAAVLQALERNPAFNSQLQTINLSRADIQQASQLANPDLFYAFGVANKAYRYAIDFPIEALWLRPIRMKQAEYKAKSVSYQMIQIGYNLIRDTRLAYGQVVIARERLQTLEALYHLKNVIYQMVDTKQQLGEISEQEVLLAKSAMLVASRDWEVAKIDVKMAETKLFALIGQDNQATTLAMSQQLIPACEATDVSNIKALALASRPDILSAEMTVMASQSTSKLSRSDWIRVTASADATSGQKTGHTLGPALRFTLPIFNQNQGQIARADAELKKAEFDLAAVKQQAALEIDTAHLQYQRDCLDWQQLHEKVLPNALQAIRFSEEAYQKGDIAYLNILESAKDYSDGLLKEVQLKESLIASWSNLMRSKAHPK
ncbi:MAG: TolC family protein [Methylophilaceae bacterium]|nr:TolC family protein [Methylophilaceae bacterium]